MNPYNSGRNLFTFSNCSKAAIAAFLRLNASSCLLNHNQRRHLALLPNDTMTLPGQVISGDLYCKRTFAHPNVTYIKWDSDLKQCKFRCRLYMKPDGKPKYAIRYAYDGTPCNRSRPEMKCKNTKCV
ncbi:uncharacterized protein LOC119401513 [Rhipicephalus sanguineus]|uniref:uncharacterized protein LOC119401513 n=1 Tax=Rhipicephalus sanguineus TaxID=34632 RepID=UPI0020C54240|nr:uncharacterized protein LOC119401513 [Rhipicephalus sanguineus]